MTSLFLDEVVCVCDNRGNSISQRAVQSISASKRALAVVKAQQETSSMTVLRFQSHLVVRCLIQRVFQSSEQVIELLWQSESLL